MKAWLIAGLFTIATAPFAAASATEEVIDCTSDETRRAGDDHPTPAPAPGVAARPTVTQRDVGDDAPRQTADRRRSGKRIPDAELIGPRGAL